MSYLPISKDSKIHDVVGNPDLELREQDRWLPIANVARLMKSTLPPTAKVSKDAKECMQECVSEFISFITSEASDKCLREKRKTINGEDVLYSLHDLGFENYAEVLKIYLAKYREQQAMRQERGEPRTIRKPSKKQKSSGLEEDADQEELLDVHNPEDSALHHAVHSVHNVPYEPPSPRKELQSPDFFQNYNGADQGDNNALGGASHHDSESIKHELDISENLQMNGKDHYQYGDFIAEAHNETPKDNQKGDGLDPLSKLDGSENDLDNLGVGMEERNYF